LEAARDLIRTRGFTATTVDDLCRDGRRDQRGLLPSFRQQGGARHRRRRPLGRDHLHLLRRGALSRPTDPLDRLLGYVEFRKTIIDGDLAEFTCLVGTMTQEVYASHPGIRDACAASIFGHAATIEPDIRPR
jgi:TetR/AcrR family transcriptional repressor of nem operon